MPLLQTPTVIFPGFQREPPPPPTAPVENSAENAAVFQDTISTLIGPLTGNPHLPVLPKTRELFNAAFRMDNDVLNAYDYMSGLTKKYVDEPGFDVLAQLKKDGLFDQYSDNFVGVRSRAEYNDTASKIRTEDADKALMNSSGLAGMIAGSVAGMSSPTMLLPIAAEGRGVVGLLQALGLGAIAGLAHEVPLQLNQETRPLSEGITGVAMSTILGGVLGSAHQFLTKPLEEVAAGIDAGRGNATIPIYKSVGMGETAVPNGVVEEGRISPYAKIKSADTRLAENAEYQQIVARTAELKAKMANTTENVGPEMDEIQQLSARARVLIEEAKAAKNADLYAIPQEEIDAYERGAAVDLPTSGATPASVGAEAASVPDVKVVLPGLVRSAGYIMPVARGVTSKSKLIKFFTSQITEGGLHYENSASFEALAPGGTAEMRTLTYNGHLATTIENNDRAYAQYMLENDNPNWLQQQWAKGAGLMPNRTKMSRSEFNAAISWAMEHGDVHDVPQVQQIAQERRALVDMMYQRALDSGIYKRGLEDVKENVLGAQSYMTRHWNGDYIAAHSDEWDQMAVKHFSAKLEARYAQDLKKVLAKADEKATAEFLKEWESQGVRIGSDITKANFTDMALSISKQVRRDINGLNARLLGPDLLLTKKGAEIARLLDFPSEDAWAFLHHDNDQLLAKYVNTLAPDIELSRVLGPDFLDAKGDFMIKLENERDAMKQELEAKLAQEGKTADQIAKAKLALDREIRGDYRELETMISRLRHTHGIPDNPGGIAERAGKIARELNTLRYMNFNVVTSSIPDLGRPLMKYGMLKTFRDGWVPFIQHSAVFQATKRELRLSGAAVDMALHSRAHAISDIDDYTIRGSRFEKALDFVSSKMGLIGGFDIWTTGMKQITGLVANAEITDDIKMLMLGKASPRAKESLAAAGIDEGRARIIWREMQKPGGADEVNGTLWPNTAAWENQEAVQTYHQALVQHVNNTIITPGVGDRPTFMTKSLTGKILFQFKSFGMSSVTKTMLAGLQKHDVKSLYGAMISVALGSLSYIIGAKLAGGWAEEQLNAAVAQKNWGHFFDEGFSRAGLNGIYGNVLDAASTLPNVGKLLRLGGMPTQRTSGDDMWDQLLGPSYDLGSRIYTLAADAASGKVDRNTFHHFSMMLPLQNNYLVRRLLNRIEEGLPAR